MAEHEEDARARELCLRWLAAAPRTRSQLAERLRRKRVTDAVAGRVLDRLEAAGLVNDEALARAWIRSHAPEGAMGRRRLALELARRGLGRELTATLLDEEAPADEGRAAAALAQSLAARYRGLPRETARRRLAGFLARRGFGVEDVRAAVDAVLPRGEDEERAI